MDALISVSEAVARLRAAGSPVGFERAALSQAYDRVLAEPVLARFDIPHFTRAVLDGFAVRAADVAGASRERPIVLPVALTVGAGAVSAGLSCPHGAAVRTMTGAAMAEGADAIVRLEHADEVERDGQRFAMIYQEALVGEAVQPQGHDVRAGDLLFPAGTRLGPVELGVLASHGYESVEVSKRPRVGILATGSELISLGEPMVEGKLYNSNTPLVAGVIRSVGGEPLEYPPVPDDPATLRESFASALNACDVLVTTGGVSVGDFDRTPSVLEALGTERLFWGVWMRPGTPVYAGVYEGRTVLALSGNPGAAYVNAVLLLIPVLESMLGLTETEQRTLRARIARAPKKRRVRHTRFFRGQLFYEGNDLCIDLGRDQSPSVLGSFVGIAAFACIEADDLLEDGTWVSVLLIR